MFGIGGQELLFIFLIVLLIFGGTKIPEIARGLGKGIREFKKAKDGMEEDLEQESKTEKPAGKSDAKTSAAAPGNGTGNSTEKKPLGNKDN